MSQVPAAGWYCHGTNFWLRDGTGTCIPWLEIVTDWSGDSVEHPSPALRKQFNLTFSLLGFNLTLEWLSEVRKIEVPS